MASRNYSSADREILSHPSTIPNIIITVRHLPLMFRRRRLSLSASNVSVCVCVCVGGFRSMEICQRIANRKRTVR